MKTIRILHMYADMLDLYGDSGNMEVMAFRCKKRGIECQIDKYSIDSEMPDFSAYDLIYICGGADLEQQHISADLLKCRDGIVKAYKNGTFLFLICGGYQLMGKYYRDADGNGRRYPVLRRRTLHPRRRARGTEHPHPADRRFQL